MQNIIIHFAGERISFPLIYIAGTSVSPFLFGVEDNQLKTHVPGFYISKFQVTQEIWTAVMGNNPSEFIGIHRPVECVSFNDITGKNGFLERLHENELIRQIVPPGFTCQLPSETQWEFAARGGNHWTDGFTYSGSNTLDEVGWYELNAGPHKDVASLHSLKNQQKATETHSVGQKTPNQLGICDMSGNVWEWCQDYFHADVSHIPKDGTACLNKSDQRVLRGGCHHNWDIHCRVDKRYAIAPEAADNAIGFRIVLSQSY